MRNGTVSDEKWGTDTKDKTILFSDSESDHI